MEERRGGLRSREKITDAFSKGRHGRRGKRKASAVRVDEAKRSTEEEQRPPSSRRARVGRRSDQQGGSGGVSKPALRKFLQILRRRLLNDERGRKCRESSEHFQESCEKLDNLIRSTIIHGTNNSVLLVGAPGSAKKEVLERVLGDLLAEFNEEGKSASVGVVRLSGLLHSDECSALREIARQLCDTWDLNFLKSASFSTNLRFLREILSELDKGHKTVIFVLDCLDLYTTKQKQGLLYNLLDALQGSQAQAAVVGLSSRHDCLELMEKRARSRFSYRKVVTPAPPPEEGIRVLKELLTVPEGSAGDDGLLSGSDPSLQLSGERDEEEVKAFNREVAAMLCSEESKAVLDRFFKCNATIYTVEQLVLGLICSMDGSVSTLTLPMLRAACGSMSVTTLVKQGLQMSVLDLTMLVAMQRLEKRGKESYNFQHIYKEVESLRSADQRFGQEAALESYVRLVEQKFVETIGDHRRQQEFRPSRLLMMGCEIERIIAGHPNCPESLRRSAANIFL
ncbi:subunit 4 of origin recognition complex [Chloropicon primus]|uniref:Subunit 4 of origin recognition complex n=2 Tax=Chloropicon primus TaxID=1764295 RepID=A0A5B8MGV2_9CHLO|nr:subunit 4 of origin recognition complex [Chloropicon primus]UPQ98773.1 subunit 4 of origin recognition complex [Chloropicon primus]|eukprot:QDZ19561.1 subunit 4 of origin recognition complex [Chloropicon primus]